MLTPKSSEVEVFRIPFAGKALNAVHTKISQQYEAFCKLKPVAFNGQYKADDDECLCIKDFVNTDSTFSSFADLVDGKSCGTLNKTDDLYMCRSLLYLLPAHPDLILIQRFTRSLLVGREKYFRKTISVVGNGLVDYIDDTAFTIGPKLVGYYDKVKNILYFDKINGIQRALPGFSEKYVPEADLVTMKNFFATSIFDKDSYKAIKEELEKGKGIAKSVKIARLVWLLHNQKISGRMEALKKIDKKLNINCINNGKIVVSNEVDKMVVILKVLNGDVYEVDKKIYMTNSKKELLPF